MDARVKKTGWVLAVWVSLALAGCGTKIGTRDIGFEPAYRQINTNAIQNRGFSTTSGKVLRRYDLEERFKADPKPTLAVLAGKVVSDKRRDLLFALAELNYHAAGGPAVNRQEGFSAESRQYYLNAALFAWFCLFEPDRDPAPDAYNRYFRWTCDIYNIALARALSDDSGHLVPESRAYPLPSGAIPLVLRNRGVDLDPASPDQEILAADRLEISGLSHRNRDSGIGVPFVLVKKPLPGRLERSSEPGTLVLKPAGGVNALADGTLTGSLLLFSAFETGAIQINGKAVPLERDISVHLAHSLNNSFIRNIGFREFFSGSNPFKTGIYKMMPFSPDKIPVVFVHGTFSNPFAWIEMANTLMADPGIRRRCQFWFYLYDTNRPIALSARAFRQALMQKRKRHDPEGTNPHLNEMVLIGHSQGGLLTKLAVTDTEDIILREVIGKSLADLNLTPDKAALLKEGTVFEALPFVSRAVFISTPHRGSELATAGIRNLMQRIVTLPSEIIQKTRAIVQTLPSERIPEAFQDDYKRTSIDSMSPDNRGLLALSRIPPAPGVTVHSIIAVQGDGDAATGSDGVVTYQSAHVDYAASEFIVQPCGHSSQWHPSAIEEVRRILLRHLDDLL